MSQFLPCWRFDWLGPEEYHRINWQQLPDDEDFGSIIEFDLEYPAELHEALNNYPLAPERLDIQVDMLFDAQVAISRHYARTRAAKNMKLVTNLMNKKNYFTLPQPQIILGSWDALHNNPSRNQVQTSTLDGALYLDEHHHAC